jgi:hypothetical protein
MEFSVQLNALTPLYVRANSTVPTTCNAMWIPASARRRQRTEFYLMMTLFWLTHLLTSLLGAKTQNNIVLTAVETNIPELSLLSGIKLRSSSPQSAALLH